MFEIDRPSDSESQENSGEKRFTHFCMTSLINMQKKKEEKKCALSDKLQTGN